VRSTGSFAADPIDRAANARKLHSIALRFARGCFDFRPAAVAQHDDRVADFHFRNVTRSTISPPRI
jgi:hypothetical protein